MINFELRTESSHQRIQRSDVSFQYIVTESDASVSVTPLTTALSLCPVLPQLWHPPFSGKNSSFPTSLLAEDLSVATGGLNLRDGYHEPEANAAKEKDHCEKAADGSTNEKKI